MTVKTGKHITAEELHSKLKHIHIGGNACHYSLKKCEEYIPLINEINQLKDEQNAIILVHSYVSPEIIYGVGDFIGDSYGLSKKAMETKADTIVFSAVRFMGETAKILNPDKDVLLPGLNDGCTLADSVTAQDVKRLKEKFPNHTFVCYINTTADVKAECDVCVTSANVYKIIERIPNDKIYFLPDKLMGLNVQAEMLKRGVHKEIQIYDGTCYVHEEFDPKSIDHIREEYPTVRVLSHPECHPTVLDKSDFVGSTTQMEEYLEHEKDGHYFMLTECGLSTRLQAVMPKKNFVGTCTLCRYMKSNTLADIKRVLTNPSKRDRVSVDESVRKRALLTIEAMFKYAEG